MIVLGIAVATKLMKVVGAAIPLSFQEPEPRKKRERDPLTAEQIRTWMRECQSISVGFSLATGLNLGLGIVATLMTVSILPAMTAAISMGIGAVVMIIHYRYLSKRSQPDSSRIRFLVVGEEHENGDEDENESTNEGSYAAISNPVVQSN